MIATIKRIEPQRIGRARRPQPQSVGEFASPTHDWRIVGNRIHRFRGMPDILQIAVFFRPCLYRAAKSDLMRGIWPWDLPWIAVREPVLGILALPAVLDDLAEHPVCVADAVAMSRDAQRRHAFHKACGQPS